MSDASPETLAVERILSKTRGVGDCMEYTGCVQSNGYSRVRFMGGTDYGHRVVAAYFYGEPDGPFDVMHSCDNRKCINPFHLSHGTRKDNMSDCVKKGRQARGRRVPQAKLDEQSVAKAREAVRLGETVESQAAKYGVHRTTMKAAVLGLTWKEA